MSNRLQFFVKVLYEKFGVHFIESQNDKIGVLVPQKCP